MKVNIRSRRTECVVAIDRLPELRELHVGSDRIEIGAAQNRTWIRP